MRARALSLGFESGLNPPNACLAPLGEVMLPNPHDAPAFLAQRAVDPLVPGLVGGHLLFPEGAVESIQPNL